MLSVGDPRRNGFNYAGWGADPKPPIYQAAQKIALVLSQRATAAQQESWALEMKIRDIRLATSSVEKNQAVQRLEAAVAKYHNLAI